MKVLYANEDGELKFGEKALDYAQLWYLPTIDFVKMPCFLNCRLEDLKYKCHSTEVIFKPFNNGFLNLESYTDETAKEYSTRVFKELGQWQTQMSIAYQLIIPTYYRRDEVRYLSSDISATLGTLHIAGELYNIPVKDYVRKVIQAIKDKDFDDLLMTSCILGNYLQDTAPMED